MQAYYDAYDQAQESMRPIEMSAIDAVFAARAGSESNGFERIARCRRALDAIDSQVKG